MQAGPVATIWAEAPAATRFVIASNGSLAVLSIFIPAINFFFQLSLIGLFKGNFAAFVTYFLAGSLGQNPILGLLFFFFGAMMAVNYFSPLEREFGTLRFVAWLCIGSIFIGFIHIVFAWLFAQFDPMWYLIPCTGPWPLLILAMTRQCLAVPDQSLSFWGIVQIPGRWYPMALVAFFSLLNMRLEVSLAAAVLLGIGAHHSEGEGATVPRFEFLKIPFYSFLPREEFAKWVEDGDSSSNTLVSPSFATRLCLGPIKAIAALCRRCPAALSEHYVRIGDAQAPPKPSDQSGGSAVAPTTFGRSSGRAADAGSSGSSNFVPFSGAGHKLGGEP